MREAPVPVLIERDDFPSVPSIFHERQHAAYDRLFYKHIRSLLGGRITYLLSGASPLDADLGNFFRGAGIPVVEGYGLTETTAPIAGNRPRRMRAGSVGTPIPGSTIRISERGEVLVKGVGVTPGYLNPSDDISAFDDGFCRTDDVGRLDDDDFLYIQGRLKEVLAHVQRTVDRANSAISRAEQVRRFAVVVAKLSEENGTLTPTQKLRRTPFLKQAEAHIATIYDEEATS